eukprot:TRINITY_DN8022_c0_g1_i1.p1 TRINITY_DN8022_c0_g1~~TRINITY_DN8022_c0_g1_i1.p1  ORF type:complete len:326 (+),score=-1.38 TRINITY_DN8022_c0_g1_i1:99-1076(+)
MDALRTVAVYGSGCASSVSFHRGEGQSSVVVRSNALPLAVAVVPARPLCRAQGRPVTRLHVATKDAVEGGSPDRKEGSGSNVPGDGDESDEEVATLVRGVSFAALCDDFECVSSPAVERTARQLARDIHDMREDKRTLSCFAVDVTYSDPLRSFKGRDKYRRPSWLLAALSNPSVHMLGMTMKGTSTLEIRWCLEGDFQLPAASLLGGKLCLDVSSTFTLNQISGLVTEHRDQWDLSRCPPPAQVMFAASRLAWSLVQASKDASDGAASLSKSLDSGNNNSNIYPDPSGDPRKFLQQSDPNRDLYQAAFFIALMYFVVRALILIL